mmetsp:Transcript_7331/g.27424  ORF Transcript_7331/g.27424 Transcript_7331/m.27424 type:complete len:244 (+) Transcript_7331:565-1296(+)
MSQEESNAGEGVEIKVNEPFENKELGNGQYTKKIYHAGQRLPAFLKKFVPSKMLDFHEEAWNAYPYCKTIITCPYFGEKFGMSIISQHKAGAFSPNEDEQNIHKLSEKVLKKRTVKYIDIAADKPEKYTKETDPKLHKLDKVQPPRGPLTADDWWNKEQTTMTCYKLVTVKCAILPGILTKQIEKKILDLQRLIFLQVHRKLYCTGDEWIDLTAAQIKELEDEVQRKNDELYKNLAAEQKESK